MKIWKADNIENLKPKTIVSVTGCGGKTTFIEYLASVLGEKYVVGVASTVNMAYPLPESYTKCFVGSCDEAKLSPGIYYFADEIIDGKVRKLHGLTGTIKREAIEKTDILFIEADGSAHRPLKAWRDDEPVIIEETDMTIGVASPDCIGVLADSHHIHRLTLYKRRYGEQTYITRAMFRRMIYGKDGMFNHAAGNTFLWLNTSKVAAVVLAAGLSKRMGENKLLMPFLGKPMLFHTLKAVGQCAFEKKYVVSSERETAKLAESMDFEVLQNNEAVLGQSRSVAIGAEACMAEENRFHGIMYFPGDMPLLTPALINKLKTAFCAVNKEKIIVPLYWNNERKLYKRGSPVIFPIKFSRELTALEGDVGGKTIFKKYPEAVYEVRISDGFCGSDIDCMEDLIRLEKIIKSKESEYED